MEEVTETNSGWDCRGEMRCPYQMQATILIHSYPYAILVCKKDIPNYANISVCFWQSKPFFSVLLPMAVIEKLYLISEISRHSRGNSTQTYVQLSEPGVHISPSACISESGLWENSCFCSFLLP